MISFKSNFIHLVLVSLLPAILSGCFSSEETSVKHSSAQKQITAADLDIDHNGMSKAKATIKTAHGNIVFKFYPKQAPHTVTRIIELINKGFYDGLTFHRVIPNFVIQGGDPTATGMGGSGQKLKAEFNDIQHIKGTIAMARAEDINSADSQFYIALTTLSHLDQNYTIFGQVIAGLEILGKIKKGDRMLAISFQK